jgi:glycosyltransferase involved in cell wall biosynthesis
VQVLKFEEVRGETRLMKMTIIIPTRNRAETLRHALATCTSQGYADLEIIVSDNCSADDTEAVVRGARDPRVKYLRTPRRFSMTGNFEFALAHVRDGFVGIMGDDDGLMPGAIERASHFLESSGLTALTSVLAFYRWPSAPATMRNTGALQYCKHGDSIRDSRDYMKRSLEGSGAYYIHDLPSLYYGFAHVSLLRPTSDDRFFHSITPDAYSAFAIALQVPKYGYLGSPLFVVGASGRSNGVSNLEASANRAEANAFQAENDLPFHPDFVFCRSIAMTVHEAYAQAAERYPAPELDNSAAPMTLIRQMALEVEGEKPLDMRAFANKFGGKHGIRQKRISLVFDRRVIAVLRGQQRAMRLLNKLARHWAGSTYPVSSKQYSQLDQSGIGTVEQAASFFDSELRQITTRSAVPR